MRLFRWLLLSALIAGGGLMSVPRLTAQTFTGLYSFTTIPYYISPYLSTNRDGGWPLAGVIVSGSTLYGTASSGGTNGGGTVFAINTDGSGFTNLHSFQAADGTNPVAGLVLSGSTLYGTTALGGAYTNGTVFAINTNGTGFTVRHTFSGTSDGANPQAGLILAGGRLYGTAENGGASGNGTVFAINTDGTGFANLYSFSGGSDGANPAAGLVLSGGRLYGTAEAGGASGNGTVFAINTNGTGFATLYSFSDGGWPEAALILSGSGNTLYGTTCYGGANGYGSVFALNTNGSGFTTLYSFTSAPNDANSDGANPAAALVLSGNTLYGVAQVGGTNANGTVFAISTNGGGFTNLYTFTANPSYTNTDGIWPNGLILLGNTLYGTAHEGGSNGCGTVFALSLGSSPPVALVTAGPTNGVAPLSVIFTNLSTGATNYAWAFGDGNVSALANPTNTYTNAGTYSVTLTAVGPGGTNQLTLTNYIVVTNPMPPTLLAYLSYSAVSGFQFTVTNADGTAVTASEQSRLQVYATTNPAVALTNWTALTNATVLTNGALKIQDPDNLLYPQRFYRSALKP
jgi:uncharacterized repeat protein (TIGR03803 family)